MTKRTIPPVVRLAGALALGFALGWLLNAWQPANVGDETLRLLVTSAAGVFGAFVGVAGALVVADRQHDRTIAAERQREARTRAHESALTIDQLMQELAADVPDEYNPNIKEDSGSDRARKERIWRNLERVERLSVDLPTPWKGRMLEAQSFMKGAWELSSDGYLSAHHYHSTRRIASRVNGDAHELLAAFLNNDTEPPAQSDDWLEYRVAFDSLIQEKETEFAPEMAEDEEKRETWLAQRPLLREELRARRTPKTTRTALLSIAAGQISSRPRPPGLAETESGQSRTSRRGHNSFQRPAFFMYTPPRRENRGRPQDEGEQVVKPVRRDLRRFEGSGGVKVTSTPEVSLQSVRLRSRPPDPRTL